MSPPAADGPLLLQQLSRDAQLRRWRDGAVLAAALLLPTAAAMLLRHHWDGLMTSKHQILQFTDTLHMPMADDEDGTAAAGESVAGDETHCQRLFDAVMTGHQSLLMLGDQAQAAIDDGGSMGWCLLACLSLALTAAMQPDSLPLMLLVLQLCMLLCLFCHEVQQATAAMQHAAEVLVSADRHISTWPWPATAPLAVFRGLLHQALSSVEDSWRGKELALQLPWLPLLGQLELSPDTVIQAALTSAASCGVNLLAMVRPDLSLLSLCQAAFAWLASGGRSTGDKAAADEPDPRSLFEKLGGAEAVKLVVEALYQRLLGDPRLQTFFKDIDVGFLKRKQELFITAAFDGPVQYDGPSLRSIHMKLVVKKGLNVAHFDGVVGHLLGAMSDVGVPPVFQAETMFKLAGLRTSFAAASDLESLLFEWPATGEAVIAETLRAAGEGAAAAAPALVALRPLLRRLAGEAEAARALSRSAHGLLQLHRRDGGQAPAAGVRSYDWTLAAHMLTSSGVDVAAYDALSNVAASAFVAVLGARGLQQHTAAWEALQPLRQLLGGAPAAAEAGASEAASVPAPAAAASGGVPRLAAAEPAPGPKAAPNVAASRPSGAGGRKSSTTGPRSHPLVF